MDPKLPIIDSQSPKRRQIHVFPLVAFSLLGLLVLTYVFVVPHYTICDLTPHRLHSLDFVNLRTAIEAFHADTHRYPTTAEGFHALISQPNNTEGWHGPYLYMLDNPLDEWGHPYLYRSPGILNPTSFDLISPGPDGIEGTADDLTKDSK
jgi:type II secretion system protein G